MRDRLVTALGALLALAAVILVVLADHDPPPSRPTSVEPGPNGYRALRDWLHESGVNAVSHRHGWDALKDYGNGNLLIVTLPLQTRMREGEAGAMLPWVAEGNTLLLMAALNDTPDWSLAAPGLRTFEDDLESLTLLRFEAAKAQDGQTLEAGVLGEETRLDLAVVQAHPLAEGVGGLVGVTDAPASVWQVDAAPDEVRLRVAIATPHGTDAIWHVPFGRGDIFVSALGSLFTNRVIAQADNATLFANLVRHHVEPAKAVIFDDLHQGLAAYYGPTAFYQDPRLHASIAFVLALWFLYMVGTWNRLAPMRDASNEPGQQEFVYAVGGFLARKLSAVDAGRMLFASWFSALQGKPTSFERPPWQRLEANPVTNKELLTALQEDHARLRSGKKVQLRKLHNRIRRLTAGGGGAA